MFFKFLSVFTQMYKAYCIKWNMLVSPILLLILLSMMIFPLPGFVLDVFFTFNIVLSIIVLLVAMFTKNTLDFISFPIAILFSTLLRLSLNIGSTRTILLQGHTGSYAAGNVVKAFGHFLVGNNFSVGIVVFIILIVINFLVITKGAGRIAEVGARFALDGMPGKQMSIDADFNAGLISEKEAKKRRLEVYQESEFYGAMDGASKFIRGDAIAGIIVMVINITGGLIVGIVQHHMSFIEATKDYTLLTIGDGLVAQIPSLLISIAAGIIVTRINTEQNITEQLITQVFCNPIAIFFTGCLLGIMGLIPGMPKIIFFLFAIVLFILSWFTYGKVINNVNASSITQNFNVIKNENLLEVSWKDVQLEDCVRIELSNELLPLIDINKKNNLLIKIRSIRKKFAQEVGFVPPVVHVKNNFMLPSSKYRILIKGVECTSWIVNLNYWLAINVNKVLDKLPGEEIIEPTFGIQSYWIKKDLKNKAEKMGFMVVDNVSVISTHFNKIMYQNMGELFGYYETQKLLDKINAELPKFVEELVPNLISLSVLNKVLKNLLYEQVFIKDIKTILETILEHVSTNKNPDYLTSVVRIALGKIIVQNIFKDRIKINAIGLDLSLENILLQSFEGNQEIIEPGLLNNLIIQTKNVINQQILSNNPIVLIVNHKLRMFLSKLLRPCFNELVVLSNAEIPNDKKIHIVNILGKQHN
ncbi:flagellar biosynthetic protein [Buchnera aphidicola (Nipponaphis monzeni)]|uniref:Flagellar biosynthesis protein FlhA n=1 Tax=Buchnera aphidicola (Nipponaphis monzeni) TaxID=2495405 RepID=A0A455TA71_9GAMM|nr:flagellar biosynthesis protein FlhA [Buchnera aphidicola]BBI01205.1 flagellar biosynthetic protein [Buchnera aphidicola (Nipponaphis monzeni)]